MADLPHGDHVSEPMPVDRGRVVQSHSGLITVSADFHVADGRVPIMGRDLQKLLSVTVSCGSTKSWAEDQVLFSDQVLPAIKRFIHKVSLMSVAVPVSARMRMLLYAVRQEFSDHFLQLQSQGVIERVASESSPWLSPIPAVKEQEDRRLRACLDLTEINKAIIDNGPPLLDMQARNLSPADDWGGGRRLLEVDSFHATLIGVILKIEIIEEGHAPSAPPPPW